MWIFFFFYVLQRVSNVWIFFLLCGFFFLLELHIGVKAKQEGSDDHDFGLRRFGFEVSVSVPDRDTK